MTARRASDMQIERLTFTWTPLDELADPPTGLDPATEIAQLRTPLEHRDILGMAKGMLMEPALEHQAGEGGRRTGGPAFSHGEQSESRRRGSAHRRFGGT